VSEEDISDDDNDKMKDWLTAAIWRFQVNWELKMNFRFFNINLINK
jgi:hypothetical protein